MATVKSFEELDVWKRARVFAKRIYGLTNDGTFAKDYSLKDQINRSAGSIMDNIAEGFERGGNREFITFLSYSKGPCGETRAQLYRAFDRSHIDERTLSELNEEGLSISKMISGLIAYLKQSEMKGSKFHEPGLPYE